MGLVWGEMWGGNGARGPAAIGVQPSRSSRRGGARARVESLYHDIRSHFRRHCPETDVPLSAADRLALLITGLLAAQSCVLAKVAAELESLGLTAARVVESIGRRLRRTLNDAALTATPCYTPLLPPGAEVVVVGDRAFAVPALLDRLAARGWHWVRRLTTTGSHRFRPADGTEPALGTMVRRHLGHAGTRWRARGDLFKDAGWRAAGLVGIWAVGANEPLVVITDLRPTWGVLRAYDRRFWIEPGLRNDKSRGWQWERCQVRGVAHHRVLLVALAWATLVALCLGAGEAAGQVRRLAQRPARWRKGRWRCAKPQPARENLFTLGLRAARRWRYETRRRPWRWRLPDRDAPNWTDQWRLHQALRFIFDTPVRS